MIKGRIELDSSILKRTKPPFIMPEDIVKKVIEDALEVDVMILEHHYWENPETNNFIIEYEAEKIKKRIEE